MPVKCNKGTVGCPKRHEMGPSPCWPGLDAPEREATDHEKIIFRNHAEAIEAARQRGREEVMRPMIETMVVLPSGHPVREALIAIINRVQKESGPS